MDRAGCSDQEAPAVKKIGLVFPIRDFQWAKSHFVIGATVFTPTRIIS
jgi:hypothetical protein